MLPTRAPAAASALLLAFLSTPAPAELLTGQRLADSCRSEVAAIRSICDAYVLGVIEGAIIGQHVGREEWRDWCLPAGVTESQLTKRVRAHIDRNDSELEQPASMLVYRTLIRSYPCVGSPVSPRDLAGSGP